jgi:hypothetical protein
MLGETDGLETTHTTTTGPMEISLTEVIQRCEPDTADGIKEEDTIESKLAENNLQAQQSRMQGLMRQLTLEGRATPIEGGDKWTITHTEEQKLQESYLNRQSFLNDSANEQVRHEYVVRQLEGETLEPSEDHGQGNVSRLREQEQLAQAKRITGFMAHLMTEADATPHDDNGWWSVKKDVLQNLQQRYEAYTQVNGLSDEILTAKKQAEMPDDDDEVEHDGALPPTDQPVPLVLQKRYVAVTEEKGRSFFSRREKQRTISYKSIENGAIDFVEKGDKLTAKPGHGYCADAMVLVALERGATSITIGKKASPEFSFHIACEARARDLKVHGFKWPPEAEKNYLAWVENRPQERSLQESGSGRAPEQPSASSETRREQTPSMSNQSSPPEPPPPLEPPPTHVSLIEEIKGEFQEFPAGSPLPAHKNLSEYALQELAVIAADKKYFADTPGFNNAVESLCQDIDRRFHELIVEDQIQKSIPDLKAPIEFKLSNDGDPLMRGSGEDASPGKVIYVKKNGDKKNGDAYVLLPPFNDQKNEPQQVLVVTAQQQKDMNVFLEPSQSTKGLTVGSAVDVAFHDAIARDRITQLNEKMTLAPAFKDATKGMPLENTSLGPDNRVPGKVVQVTPTGDAYVWLPPPHDLQKARPDILRVSHALQIEMGVTLKLGASTEGMKAGEKATGATNDLNTDDRLSVASGTSIPGARKRK